MKLTIYRGTDGSPAWGLWRLDDDPSPEQLAMCEELGKAIAEGHRVLSFSGDIDVEVV